MRIAFLSHTAMGGDFVVGSHHLAAAFAARGHQVQHVSAPVTPAHVLGLGDRFVRTRLARWWRGGEVLAGVRDVVPFSPLPWSLARSRPALMRAHSRWMLAAPLRGIGALRLDDSDHLVVDEPRFFGIATARSPQASLAYRATDLYAAMRGDARIADAERILCRRAATVVATSEQVATHLRSLSNRQVHVISNGVDFQHFHTPRDLQCSPPLAGSARSHRAVYVGAFDARFCHRSVHAAARAHPSRSFLLAGPGSQRVADELGLPNVQGLGAVAYEELPALLQSCAVGLLPFSASDANAGRSPMKLFEYAAAGLAVAATQSFRQGRAVLPTLSLASTTEDFAQAVARSFEFATDATAVAAAREAARAQDWGAKAGELMCLLQHGRADAPMPEAAADAPPLLPVPSSWN